jgi:hypothetical protein
MQSAFPLGTSFTGFVIEVLVDVWIALRAAGSFKLDRAG